jgi:hypothetical protein
VEADERGVAFSGLIDVAWLGTGRALASVVGSERGEEIKDTETLVEGGDLDWVTGRLEDRRRTGRGRGRMVLGERGKERGSEEAKEDAESKSKRGRYAMEGSKQHAGVGRLSAT